MIRHTIYKLVAMLFAFSLVATNLAQAQNMYKPITGSNVRVGQVLNSGFLCVTQLCLGNNFYGLQNIVDDDVRTAALSASFKDVLNTKGISVKNYDTVYPAGYVAGYLFSSESMLSIGIMEQIHVATYLNGSLQESKSMGSLLTASLLTVEASKNYLTFVTTKSFDEVRFYTTGLSTSFINGIKIYSAFAFPSTGQPVAEVENCNMPINGNHINVSYNGPGVCAGCNLINADNINDAYANNYASLITPAALLSKPTVGVLNTAAVYPAGYNAGFVLSNADGNAVGLATFFSTMTVETYLFGQLQERSNHTSATGGSLLSLKLFTKNFTNLSKIGFKTTKPFNEVRYVQNAGATASLSQTKIYYAYAEPGDCTDCKTYLGQSATGEFSGKLVPNTTGFFGIGKETFNGTYGIALQSLTGINNAISANKNDYALYSGPLFISIGAGARVSVMNNGTAFPAGTHAGFDIIQEGGLFDVSLLSGITIKTYMISGSSKVLREIIVGNAQLLGLDLLPGASSKATVGFKTTKSFNAVQIEMSSGLVSAGLGNRTRVYGAYILKDADGDGFGDCIDFCPGDNNIDTDFDGVPDACDNCNVGSVPPNMGNQTFTNNCDIAETTVTLPLTAVNGNYVNTRIEYHSVPTPVDASTRLSNVFTASNNNVYAVFYDTVYECYSISTPIEVIVSTCIKPNLQPEILYGESKFGMVTMRLGIKIENVHSANTTGPISFTLSGLPLDLNLVDFEINPSASGTIDLYGKTYNYNNADWTITRLSSESNRNLYRFESQNLVINGNDSAIVYVIFKAHNSNFGDKAIIDVTIDPFSGGEVDNTNNTDQLEVIYDFGLVSNVNKNIDISSLNMKLELFPNPTKDKITLSGLKQGSTIEVFNTVGQKVMTLTSDLLTKVVDLSTLPAGSYMIKVTDAANEVTTLKAQKL